MGGFVAPAPPWGCPPGLGDGLAGGWASWRLG